MRKNFLASVGVLTLCSVAQAHTMPKSILCAPEEMTTSGVFFRYGGKAKKKCSIGRQTENSDIKWTDFRCHWVDQEIQYEFDLEFRGKYVFRVEISKNQLTDISVQGSLIGEEKNQKYDHKIECEISLD